MSSERHDDEGAGRRADLSPHHVTGTMIRGADGKMYFIPDKALARFHVTNEEDQHTLEHIHSGDTDLIQTEVDARRVAATIFQVVHIGNVSDE